ncbi:hypothetical protein OSB04_000734 [Centaurea solstitialis]|uniref:Reverse transcriptase zinc-binding domain-containing protein n=1 Tax=Centaurea solstitialis TaxID=347529 RepID=A0AA38TX46_9ASTR|nr:hypothetical protein OSB04_000734 [Centaurea solstitialis]
MTKAVLGSTPLYFLSLFRAPSGVIGELERIRKNFFGGGGGECNKSSFAWVKWKTILKPFHKGGLNVGCLKDMNHALLAKWWWRFRVENGTFWNKVIRSIYGSEGGCGGREEVGSGRGGSVWRNIVGVGRCIDGSGISFSESFRKVVGEGRDTRFWEDVWLGDKSLKEEFPRICRLDSSWGIGEVISEKGEWVEGRWRWLWSWRRDPRGRELGELSGWTPCRGKKDAWDWDLDPGKGFSVRKMRGLLADVGRGAAEGCKTVWSRLVPRKVNVFVWRVRLGRIPTRVLLDKRGIDLDSVLCPRCGEYSEDIDHALLNCEVVKNLWLKVGNWWNKPMNGVVSVSQLLSEDEELIHNHIDKARWVGVKWVFLYLLWSNRNSLVFRNEKKELNGCFFEWQRVAFEWISSKSKGGCGDWFSWLAGEG